MFGRTYTNSYIIIIITSKKKKKLYNKILKSDSEIQIWQVILCSKKKKKKNLTSFTYNNNCFFKGKGTVASDFY